MQITREFEDALEEVEMPFKTYHLDFENKRIKGTCDGVTALKQAIHKALITARGEFEILYSEEYGSDIENAVFADSPSDGYIITVFPTLISECLLTDDRILDVTDVAVITKDDNFYVEIIVETIFGELEVQEVIEYVRR